MNKDELKITFLGTGTSSGIPLLTCSCTVCLSKDLKDKRLRSSIIINFKNKNILIDIGPDFRQQMLKENIQRIDSILVTHAHNDHIAGLDEIRAFNFSSNKVMDVYTNKYAEIDILNHYDYIFRENKYAGIASVNLIIIDKESFFIDDIEITPIEVMHNKLPVSAFRIKDFAYVTDIKTISDTEFEKLKGVETLIVSALRHSEHFSHFTFEDAIAFSKKIGAKQIYFTHISHKLGLHHEEVKKLPDNIHIAYDGLKIIA